MKSNDRPLKLFQNADFTVIGLAQIQQLLCYRILSRKIFNAEYGREAVSIEPSEESAERIFLKAPSNNRLGGEAVLMVEEHRDREGKQRSLRSEVNREESNGGVVLVGKKRCTVDGKEMCRSLSHPVFVEDVVRVRQAEERGGCLSPACAESLFAERYR